MFVFGKHDLTMSSSEILIESFLRLSRKELSMVKGIRKVRKSGVGREEIIADAIFFLVPAVIVFLAIFFFDIHQSFYNVPYYPFKFLLNDAWIYVGGTLLGGMIGLFMIKLLLFGVKEEEVYKNK